jgi:hypothetical protein
LPTSRVISGAGCVGPEFHAENFGPLLGNGLDFHQGEAPAGASRGGAETRRGRDGSGARDFRYVTLRALADFLCLALLSRVRCGSPKTLFNGSVVWLLAYAAKILGKGWQLSIGRIPHEGSEADVVAVVSLELLRAVVHHENLFERNAEFADLSEVFDGVSIVGVEIRALGATLGGPEEAQLPLAKYLRDHLGAVGSTGGSPDGYIEVGEAIIEERAKIRASIDEILSDTKIRCPRQLTFSAMNKRLIKVENE